jgi:tyrosyl-tRNA synthetase
MSTLISDLTWRGLIKNHTDLEALSARLAKGPLTFYCGYDPTADSLHMGSLQMIVMMRRFQLAGHRVVALAGGATGLIGDPSGRSDERTLRDTDAVMASAAAIEAQLRSLLPADAAGGAPVFVNNLTWTRDVTAIEFLRDVGKHFTINYMLAKDSVSARQEAGGISFTEFSYMLLQAYDFFHLKQAYDCELQIGGSDQWGNITAGITLIGKKLGVECHGLTAPLILRSDGKKFGKSEDGAVWLDKTKTSPFSMYQFLLNVADADVLDLVKRLTLLGREEVDALASAMAATPEGRVPQKRLAHEVVTYVHGKAEADSAVALSECLFGAGELTDAQLERLAEDMVGMPTCEVAASGGVVWEQLLVTATLASSRSEARRLVDGGGIYAWGNRVTDARSSVDFGALTRKGYILLAKGRKTKLMLRVT